MKLTLIAIAVIAIAVGLLVFSRALVSFGHHGCEHEKSDNNQSLK